MLDSSRSIDNLFYFKILDSRDVTGGGGGMCASMVAIALYLGTKLSVKPLESHRELCLFVVEQIKFSYILYSDLDQTHGKFITSSLTCHAGGCYPFQCAFPSNLGRKDPP